MHKVAERRFSGRVVAATVVVGAAVVAAGVPGVAARVGDVRTASPARHADAVQALQLQGALLVFCLLLAVGIAAYALRGTPAAGPEPAADDGAGELRAELASVRERHTVERDSLLRERAALTQRIAGLQDSVHGTFVGLSRRTLGLVERQLTFIDALEENEQDPDRLSTLFKLDHLAACMRRHSENLLVLAGADQRGARREHMPLIDVLRVSISEIEGYQRVDILPALPAVQLNGFAAGDLAHLLAELLENATACSPPASEVHLGGRLLDSGELLLTVRDEGIGIFPPDRLAELNARLTEPDPGASPGEEFGLGLYVVARLASRHGMRVVLRNEQPGLTAEVMLPQRLVVAVPEPPAPGTKVADGRPLDRRPFVQVPAAAEPLEHARSADVWLPEQPPGPAAPEPAAAGTAPARPGAYTPHWVRDGQQPGALPRRTPGEGRTLRGTAPPPHRQPTDPAAVRRLLGGLQQGTREGWRAAAAEAREQENHP